MMEGLMVENDTYLIGLCVLEIEMCTRFMFNYGTLQIFVNE
jgi:hypothetical protein